MDKPGSLSLTLDGSQDSPIVNPAFHIKTWSAENARVLINGKESADCEIGIHHELDGTELMVFLWIEKEDKLKVDIIPQ